MGDARDDEAGLAAAAALEGAATGANIPAAAAAAAPAVTGILTPCEAATTESLSARESEATGGGVVAVLLLLFVGTTAEGFASSEEEAAATRFAVPLSTAGRKSAAGEEAIRVIRRDTTLDRRGAALVTSSSDIRIRIQSL